MLSWSECKSPMRLALKVSKHMVTLNSSLTKFAGSTRSEMKRNYLHGWVVQKLFHRPCASPAKCACRCTSIPRCFLYSSSQSSRENTRLQPWPVLPKIRFWRPPKVDRRSSSQRSHRDFNRSRAQGLEIPVHRLCIVRHLSWWPQRGGCH